MGIDLRILIDQCDHSMLNFTVQVSKPVTIPIVTMVTSSLIWST